MTPVSVCVAVLQHKEWAGRVVMLSVIKHLRPVAEKCHIHRLPARAFTRPPPTAREGGAREEKVREKFTCDRETQKLFL